MQPGVEQIIASCFFFARKTIIQLSCVLSPKKPIHASYRLCPHLIVSTKNHHQPRAESYRTVKKSTPILSFPRNPRKSIVSVVFQNPKNLFYIRQPVPEV